MNLDTVIENLKSAFPDAAVERVANPSAGGGDSLVLPAADAVAIARHLRDQLGFDYASNVSGVDWPPRKIKQTVVEAKVVDGATVEEKVQREVDMPGFLEAVYHLYSITGRHGPLTIRLRTADRERHVTLPSLTSIWKSAEFQEREIFDLFGIVFEGHPDLRRILMWDEFTDHPMRKDYVAPEDYEYEPTPHDRILAAVKKETAAQ